MGRGRGGGGELQHASEMNAFAGCRLALMALKRPPGSDTVVHDCKRCCLRIEGRLWGRGSLVHIPIQKPLIRVRILCSPALCMV